MTAETFPIGSCIVAAGPFGWEFGHVVRVTDKLVFRVEPGWKREWQTKKECIVFCGTEAAAKRLLEQLKSSRAQRGEDQRKASEREKERNDKFIAAARESSR